MLRLKNNYGYKRWLIVGLAHFLVYLIIFWLLPKVAPGLTFGSASVIGTLAVSTIASTALLSLVGSNTLMSLIYDMVCLAGVFKFVTNCAYGIGLIEQGIENTAPAYSSDAALISCIILFAFITILRCIVYVPVMVVRTYRENKEDIKKDVEKDVGKVSSAGEENNKTVESENTEQE